MTAPETEDDFDERALYTTTDPTTEFRGRPLPASTTLLFKVCDNDREKFDEAYRLLRLFLTEDRRLRAVDTEESSR